MRHAHSLLDRSKLVHVHILCLHLGRPSSCGTPLAIFVAANKGSAQNRGWRCSCFLQYKFGVYSFSRRKQLPLQTQFEPPQDRQKWWSQAALLTPSLHRPASPSLLLRRSRTLCRLQAFLPPSRMHFAKLWRHAGKSAPGPLFGSLCPSRVPSHCVAERHPTEPSATRAWLETGHLPPLRPPLSAMMRRLLSFVADIGLRAHILYPCCSDSATTPRRSRLRLASGSRSRHM